MSTDDDLDRRLQLVEHTLADRVDVLDEKIRLVSQIRQDVDNALRASARHVGFVESHVVERLGVIDAKQDRTLREVAALTGEVKDLASAIVRVLERVEGVEKTVTAEDTTATPITKSKKRK